jgi:hypothetical protein
MHHVSKLMVGQPRYDIWELVALHFQGLKLSASYVRNFALQIITLRSQFSRVFMSFFTCK